MAINSYKDFLEYLNNVIPLENTFYLVALIVLLIFAIKKLFIDKE